MKILSIFLIFIFLGCAKIHVETKEPIKVDIQMRVDIYQHVVREVDSIESQIYGQNHKQINSLFGIESVYASDTSEDVNSAIQRRRSRASKVEEYFSKGYIGENRRAYLSLAPSAPGGSLAAEIKQLIEQENSDRAIIYEATANKNNADISQIEKIFFQDHYDRASTGWLFEVDNEGKYVWSEK